VERVCFPEQSLMSDYAGARVATRQVLEICDEVPLITYQQARCDGAARENGLWSAVAGDTAGGSAGAQEEFVTLSAPFDR